MKYFDSGSRDPAHALASWLESILNSEVAEIRLQSGFFSLDGIGLLLPVLEQCKQNNYPTKVLIGSNDSTTIKDDVIGLIVALGIPRDGAHLGIVSFSGAFFHPKTYHIKRSDGSQAAFVGSANLTASGLSLHVEAGIALDTRDGDEPHYLTQIAAAIDSWFTEQRSGMTLVTGIQTAEELLINGVLALTRPPRVTSQEKIESNDKKVLRPRLKRLFSLPKVKGVLPEDEDNYDTEEEVSETDIDVSLGDDGEVVVVEVLLPPAAAQAGINQVFLMTLQNTDVGVGQTTRGTTRRSPEIFIPLAARDSDADFWGWPIFFTTDSNNHYMSRFGVKMRIGTVVVDVNMMVSLVKHDLRLRSEQLRSAGNIGDILYLERSNGQSGFTYYVEVIPLGSVRHSQYLAQCVNSVRNSNKKWGYI